MGSCSEANSIMAAAVFTKAGINIAIADMLSDAAKEATAAQKDIADQIQARADDLHNVWENSYLPCELALLAEICSEPDEVANTFVHEQRAIVSTTAKFSAARQQLEYCAPAACVGALYEGTYLLAREQARAESWNAQIARRTEIARVDLVNKQKLDNRITMSTAGRERVMNTTPASTAAAAIYSGLAGQAAEAFNGALAVVGRVMEIATSSISTANGDKSLERAVASKGIGSTQQAQWRSNTEDTLRTRDSSDPLDALLKRNNYYNGVPVAQPQQSEAVQSRDGTSYDGVWYPDP